MARAPSAPPLRPRLALPCGLAPMGPRSPAPAPRAAPVAPPRRRPPAPSLRAVPVGAPIAAPRMAPVRPTLLLGPARAPFVPTRRAPLAHLLPPPSAPQRPARPAFTPTPYQVEQLLAEERAFFGRNTGRPMGYLPVRADAHPDGRVRLVVEGVPVPADAAPPWPKPATPGKQMSVLIPPAKVERPWTTAGAYLEMVGAGPNKIVDVDPDPAWFAVEDRRFISPKPGTPVDVYTTTSEQDVDATGFKAPGKKREARQQHWYNVAWVLRTGRPVTEEVIAEYPPLANFYAQNVLSAAQVDALLEREEAARRALDNPDDPHVTLSWNPQEGLLLRTRGKEQVIINAVRGLSGVRFKWSSHMGVYYRPQSVGVSESTVDIDRVARQLRAAGLVVAVERGETGTLGEANTRRRDHKFWRAERYAGRAEGALEKADEAAARAANIRSDLPIGAASRQAERAEARADRAEGKAGEHLDYVAHAAGAAQHLAGVASGYDVTAQVTRRDVEKRADAFAQLFVPRIKGRVGATKLDSSKTDNLSDYKLSWVVRYPPSADLTATVTFDGRVVTVSTYDGKAQKHTRVAVLRDDVTHVSPAEVFDRVVVALPKYVVDHAAHAPADMQTFVDELSAYGRKRGVALTKAAGVPAIQLYPSGSRYGNAWQTLTLRESRSDMSSPRERRWTLAPGEGLRFTLTRYQGHDWSGSYDNRRPDTVLGTVDLDFTHASIADAWEILLAGVRAVATGTPIALPKVKGAKGPAAERAAGSGTTGRVARDAADAPARERATALSAQLAPVVVAAAARRDALQEGNDRVAAARQVANETGKSGGYYPTPPSLAERVVALAEVNARSVVLEPEAGMGALVEALIDARVRPENITAVELEAPRAAFLQTHYGPLGVRVARGDFLSSPPTPTFDAVTMNPPFSVGSRHYTDAEHVLHALGFVRPGGTVVAIMSEGSPRSDNPRRRALHDALASWATYWEPVDAKRFRISGTDVPSVILVAKRPA